MKNNLAVIESDSVIVSMTRASQALAEAVTIGQTKMLIDVAYAAEIYSKRHHLSDEAIGRATSVKVEATRKLGEILKSAPKAKTRMNGKNFDGTKKEPSKNDAPTLEELGLSKKESAVAQKLAELPEDQFEQVRLGNVTIAKAIAAVDAKPKPSEKPQSAPAPNTPEEGAPDDTEMESVRIQEEAEIKTMQFLLASDEPLADLAAKNTQLEAQIKQLELRIAGLMNSNNEYIKRIKSLQNQLKKVKA